MKPSSILRKLGAYRRQNRLYLALGEIGRIERSLFMLDWIENRNLRMKCKSDLNKGESRHSLARAYVHFPMIDAAVFPIMYSAGIGDLTTVRVVRISPHDAKSLSTDPGRLESRRIAAFAGFLSRSAREHDLIWGRLDGAERLIDQIIAAAVGTEWDDSVRALRANALTRVITAILDETAQSASARRSEQFNKLRTRLPIQPA